MKNIKIVNTVLYEVADLLSKDATLQRLLVDDGTNLEDSSYTPLSAQEMLTNQYISIVPTVEIGLDSNVRNSFIQIYIDDITLQPTGLKAHLALFAVVDKDHIMLNGNKNRLLCIVNELVRILDEKKLSAAGVLDIYSISFAPVDKQRFCYRMAISFTDMINTKKAEL